MAESVEEVVGLRPAIKWPNDLVLDERKFAGVLTEAASDGRAVSRVIVGIGINVNQREFPIELAARATSLALARGAPVERRVLRDVLLSRLERWYGLYVDHGFKPVHPEWCRRAVTVGRPVVAGDVEGTAVALDADGALLVRDAAGRTHRIVAGEVRDASR